MRLPKAKNIGNAIRNVQGTSPCNRYTVIVLPTPTIIPLIIASLYTFRIHEAHPVLSALWNGANHRLKVTCARELG